MVRRPPPARTSTLRSRLSVWTLAVLVVVAAVEMPTSWSASSADPVAVPHSATPDASAYHAVTAHLDGPLVGSAATPDGRGFWLATATGGVYTYGDAPFFGSHGAAPLNKPIVGLAATPDGGGYWLVASDGGVFSYGDARFHGSTGAIRLNKPIVDMAPTADGGGYWLVASDGGIFTFGDARFHGSTGSLHLNKPIVAMAATPDGGGYWLVASDGGIFTFGDARFHGSAGGAHLNQPIVGMAGTADGRGYWLVAADGGVFTFGDASYLGSAASATVEDRIIGMEASDGGFGYSLIGQDGTVYPYGHAEGALVDTALADQTTQNAAAWLTAAVGQQVANQAPGNEIGLWIGGDAVQWRSNSGPGLAAAAVAAYDGDATLRSDAEQTFDTLIAEHQQPNGSFTAVAGTADPQSAPVDTMFFVSNLGMALWALRGQMPAAEAARWASAIAGGANYLVANGNLTYYTNGNICIGNALVMAEAFWATGNPMYETYYQQALSFAEHPTLPRWAGFGLQITRAPTQPNGSDGAGYFAESGGGAPGFDANYTLLQLDQLTRLYLVTGSPDILRLMNLEINQLMPLVDTSTWELDTSGGTRHPQPDRYVPFSTPALAVLALYGGRTDLLGYVSSQLATSEADYKAYITIWNPGGVEGFGIELASWVLMSRLGS